MARANCAAFDVVALTNKAKFQKLTMHTLQRQFSAWLEDTIATAKQGIGAIRRYFQELAKSGETTSNGARLVLLGHGEAGKTSLQRGLRDGVGRGRVERQRA